jgi:hypothetical protein
MHHVRQHRQRLAGVFVILLAWAGTVALHACSIPVFRYALDRWPADRFHLDVSPTDAKDEGVAKFLRNFTDNTPLNVTIARSEDGEQSRLSFPRTEPGAFLPWKGTLDAATLRRITDSPSRAEIVRRTLAGESAVWVLVESGRKDEDDRAAAALEKRLRYLETASQLPPIDPSDPTSRLGPGPALGVKFSVIRIPHDDPAEQVFVKMLAGPNDDGTLSKGTWLAVVFGRGRALGAWPAEGFGDEQVDEICLFLLGACSCEVKRMNPGWDLLVNADWDEQLRAVEEARFAEPVPDGEAPPQRATPVVPETVTFHPPAPALTPIETAGNNRTIVLILGGAVGLAALAALIAKLRTSR